VVYTPAALAGEGSLAALKARIALAMTETNQSYANAGITPRLRLVHIQQVSYAESGSVGTDVERLKNPSDGFIDSVHTLRNTYGADMVALVVESADACGQAYNIMASASEAFDVVLRPDCLTGYYSFGHEFGHLQGAQHDTYVDPTTVVYSYAHGFVYLPDRWRTVMAYDAQCTDTDPFTSCTRLQYWSNNNNTYGGAAMGDTNARNYQALNNTAYTVANFRAQKIAANFSSNFNANHTGWSAVSGTWAQASSAYYTSPGLAGKYNSIVHTGTYGDLTYQAKLKRTGCSNCANTIVIRGASSPLDSENGWRTGYWFYYTNTGSFLVLKGVSGSYTLLQDWTGSGAIHTGANWNTLKVVAVGTSLKFYINGTLVWSGTDSSLRTGRVGIEWWRPATGTGNRLYVDSSSLTTTATADILPAADVPAGVEVPGGDRPHSR
jgi:hypothetical protein